MYDHLSVTTSNKPHYALLDGLRGIAAFVILVFHYLEMVYPNDYESNWLGHGYLAVDFFFCLSGFVIGYAYDGRMESIRTKTFIRNRLIRLHPLVVLGTLIGLFGYIFNPFIAQPLASGIPQILLALFLSLLLLPAPFLDYRGGGLFPYNTPSWSLFFEYLINVVYALVLCRLSKALLGGLTFVAALVLVYCAHASSWLIGGWDISSVLDGFARVFYSFLAGLLVYRCGWLLPHRGTWFLPFVILLGVFFSPHHTNDWIFESILVVFVFPLIISLGAGTSIARHTKRVFDFLGRLSYPLYMTHITTVWLFGDYYTTYQPEGTKLVLVVSGLIMVNLLVAYVVLRWMDEPVRHWLRRRCAR